MSRISERSWFGRKETAQAKQVFNPAAAGGISPEAARWRCNPPNVVVKHAGLWSRRPRFESWPGYSYSNCSEHNSKRTERLDISLLGAVVTEQATPCMLSSRRPSRLRRRYQIEPRLARL